MEGGKGLRPFLTNYPFPLPESKKNRPRPQPRRRRRENKMGFLKILSMEEKKTPAVDQVLWELGSGRGGGLLEPELCQSQRIARR